jgi:hypothetical protein
MKRIQIPIFILLVSLVTSCGGSDSPPPTPTINAPGKSVLIAPASARTCELGTNTTTTQSTVAFSWNSASDTDSYDLKVTNLNTQEVSSQTGIIGNTAALTLTRGTPYSWAITSKNKGTTVTVSDTWKFYLSGNGLTNYAPFPASATGPLPGAMVTPTNGKVTLTWDTSDVDGDTLTYTLFMDTIDGKQTALDANKNLTVKTKEVTVTSNTVYYWRIIASDGVNSSTSVVYTFKTN